MWHDHWCGPRWLCQQSGTKNTDHSFDKPTNTNTNTRQHSSTQFTRKMLAQTFVSKIVLVRCVLPYEEGRGGGDTYKTAISMVIQLYQFATTIAGMAHRLFHNPGGGGGDELFSIALVNSNCIYVKACSKDLL